MTRCKGNTCEGVVWALEAMQCKGSTQHQEQPTHQRESRSRPRQSHSHGDRREIQWTQQHSSLRGSTGSLRIRLLGRFPPPALTFSRRVGVWKGRSGKNILFPGLQAMNAGEVTQSLAKQLPCRAVHWEMALADGQGERHQATYVSLAPRPRPEIEGVRISIGRWECTPRWPRRSLIAEFLDNSHHAKDSGASGSMENGVRQTR